MIAHKVRLNKDLATSRLDKTTEDSLSKDIWKRLTIIKTEAWYDVVKEIAKEHKVTAKLENRYRKSATIHDRDDGSRLGRIWQIDENQPIFWDLNNWRSHFESAHTLTEAIEKIADSDQIIK